MFYMFNWSPKTMVQPVLEGNPTPAAPTVAAETPSSVAERSKVTASGVVGPWIQQLTLRTLSPPSWVHLGSSHPRNRDHSSGRYQRLFEFGTAVEQQRLCGCV